MCKNQQYVHPVVQSMQCLYLCDLNVGHQKSRVYPYCNQHLVCFFYTALKALIRREDGQELWYTGGTFLSKPRRQTVGNVLNWMSIPQLFQFFFYSGPFLEQYLDSWLSLTDLEYYSPPCKAGTYADKQCT